MGADFSNRWFFSGTASATDPRAAVVGRLREALQHAGFEEVADEKQADRSLVVGPADRWVFIGDSAGSTEWEDGEGFAALSRDLSTFGPVVDVQMSDSAALHLHLYRHGRLVD